MARFFALLVLAGLLAGCAETSETQEAAPPETSVGGTSTTTQTDDAPLAAEEGDWGWAFSAGLPMTSADAQVDATNGMRMSVPEGAARLEAIANWTCRSPTCTVKVGLFPPSEFDFVDALMGEGAAAAETGTGTATVVVDAPMAGEWLVHFDPEDPQVGVAGTVTMIAWG